MNVEYTTVLPTAEALFKLYLTTGWNSEYAIDAEQFYGCFQRSWYTHFAYQDGRLVGCGRMISDGLLHALILDMIVHPDYRGRGVGRAILHNLVEKCKENRIRDIQLFSVKGKAGFYEKYGFSPRSVEGPGMEIKFLGKDYP